MRHQYLDRETGEVLTEQLLGDRFIRFFYSPGRENAHLLYKTLITPRISSILGFLNYDSFIGERITGNRAFLKKLSINFDECLDPTQNLDTARKIFERKIRYWETRPMPEDSQLIVSPADSRMIVGSFSKGSMLHIKNKFFSLEELLGAEQAVWHECFANGDFAIFRLTPEKYHYNHVPAAGIVSDFYEVPGLYHSCNPATILTVATPLSKNKRVVTVIDTDVPDGAQVGLVAMLEIAALMIGDIVQCYSEERYEFSTSIHKGMFLKKGAPKSLFRPGSSTVALLFQKERIEFCQDILDNQGRKDVSSSFSMIMDHPMVETDVKVRSMIATRI